MHVHRSHVSSKKTILSCLIFAFCFTTYKPHTLIRSDQIFRPPLVWSDKRLHSVGRNCIQIHLNMMGRSELLRDQALLDILSLDCTIALGRAAFSLYLETKQGPFFCSNAKIWRQDMNPRPQSSCPKI